MNHFGNSKNLKQSGDKMVLTLEDIIEMSEKPIYIKSPTLGKLTFRMFLVKDEEIILKYLNEYDDSEFICNMFILNQLTSPKVTIEVLEGLNSLEIKFILSEYLKINNLDKYFDFDKGNVYDNFKDGLISYRNHLLKPILTHRKQIIDSIEQTLDLVTIPQAISSYIIDSQEVIMDQMVAISKTADIIQQSISLPQLNEYLHLFDLSAAYSAITLQKIIEPQITLWTNWLNVNKNLVQAISNLDIFWDEVFEKYNISRDKALTCIKKYNWFISPSMYTYIVKDIISACKQPSRNKYHEINKVFVNYFLENGCRNLDEFVRNWETNPIFKGRMKIIRDCVNIIKSCPKGVNFSNLVVPTLIAQIDGIQQEFMKQNGLVVDYNIVYDLEGNKKKDEHGQNMRFKQYYRELTSDDRFSDAINDVFLDVLLQDTKPRQDYKTSMHFSRNKILHGENFNYGKKDYVIRCFMILDFLHGLSTRNDE